MPDVKMLPTTTVVCTQQEKIVPRALGVFVVPAGCGLMFVGMMA